MPYPLLELERESDPGGAWMSYAVRMKLDLAGVKISLKDWQALDAHARRALHDCECEADADVEAFRAALGGAMQRAGLSVPKPVADAAWVEKVRAWAQPLPVPEAVARRTGINDTRWRSLPRFARYLLIAFARKDDDERMQKVMAEIEGLWPVGEST